MITIIRPLARCPMSLVRPGDVVEDWKGAQITITAVQPTSRGVWLDYVGEHGPGLQWMPTEFSVGLVATGDQVLAALVEAARQAAYDAAEQVLA